MSIDLSESTTIRLERFLDLHSATRCALFDFDECLINGHLSRLTTVEFFKQIEDDWDFKDTSLYGISKLMNLYVGINYRRIWNTCKKLSSIIRFRPYALYLLETLGVLGVPILIVSSGLGIAIDVKFSKHANLKYEKFACELNFNDNGICIAPSEIINDERKGVIAKLITQSGRFGRVYSIGHSKGDIPMLRNSIGISLRGEQGAEDAATYVVNNFLEVSRIVCQAV